MTSPDQSPLFGMDQSELARLVEEIGQPGYRTQQLFEAIYRQRIPVIELISTLPIQLRQELSSRGLSVGSPEITSKFSSIDGTVRYLVACSDGQTVETATFFQEQLKRFQP